MRRGLVWSLIFIVAAAALSLGATLLSSQRTPALGLDLKGGISVVLQPTRAANSAQLDESVTIIQNRVNGLGFSNSNVTRQGNDVVVELPGAKNEQAALNEIGQTATLYFRPVYCLIPAYAAPAKSTTTTTAPKSSSTTAPKTGTTSASTTPTTAKSTTSTTAKAQSAGVDPRIAKLTAAYLGASSGSSTTTPATTPSTTSPSSSETAQGEAYCSASNAAALPTTPSADDEKTATVILPVDPKAFPSDPDIRYVLGPADMTGGVVSDANAELETTTGQFEVVLTLTSKGAVEFDNIASSRYTCYKQDTSNPPACSLEAFELDGVVESAPDFQASSFNGSVSISGSFTSSQASQLALVLKYGALPITFERQSVQTVSASVGKDSLRAGILAGLGGIIVVMIYILLYDRLLGLVVLAGLSVGGAILYSAITYLSHTKGLTLTLAGVTGVIVSIGITVDSYVVYFERLKDEIRAGRTVRQSTERSFARAFRTVLTADLVSFMAALILYLLTIGDVRGFAFTLGLSTILDVFTAYFFIRPAVVMVGRRRAFTDNRIFGISRGLGARATRDT